jgi:hypothetical protein
MTTLIDAAAAEDLGASTGRRERLLAWQRCSGPSCRVVVWAGARRRRTARYGSGKCRQASYRERQRARKAGTTMTRHRKDARFVGPVVFNNSGEGTGSPCRHAGSAHVGPRDEGIVPRVTG